MTVLVTGGAGYIGSHTVHELVDAGERVVVLDNLSTGFRLGAAQAGAAGRRRRRRPGAGRLADRDATGVDAIIHFAGSIVVPESVRDPLGYYRNNTVNSRALIEAAVKGGVRHFIFSSTAAVYGNPARVPVAEDAPLAPVSPYGWSKLMTEVMLRDAARRARPRPCHPALLQRRRRRPAGAHRPVDAGRHPSHQGRGAGRARPARTARRVRHRLSDAGRHLHPRLHPRHRPRPRASRGARPSARRRRQRHAQLRLRPRLFGARGDRRGAPRRRPRPAGADGAAAARRSGVDRRGSGTASASCCMDAGTRRSRHDRRPRARLGTHA